MKRVLILMIFLPYLIFGNGKKHHPADNQYVEYFRMDSAVIFSWSQPDSAWVKSAIQQYEYNKGVLSVVITTDYNTMMPVTRAEYFYNSYGLLERVDNGIYSDGWLLSTRILNKYDQKGRISEVRVQKWLGQEWSEDRLQTNYTYDNTGNLTGYQSIYWRNGSWTPPTVSVLTYNRFGKPDSQTATNPNGTIDYRIVYEYNEAGQQVMLFTQYPRGDGWNNWNKLTTQYNKCGLKESQIQYSGQGPDWVPATKTLLFAKFRKELYPFRKISICHQGRTLRVSINALDAHLRHGDCIGECIAENQCGPCRHECNDNQIMDNHGNHNKKEIPFLVYPNPAKEKITIRTTDSECSVSRIELLDFNGRLLYSVNPQGQAELVMDIGKLKKGNYIIRILSDEAYSAIVCKN